MATPKQAREYFRRLAAKERTRAAFARQEAASETDPARKRALEAIAQGHNEQAAIYDQRHDEVKDR